VTADTMAPVSYELNRDKNSLFVLYKDSTLSYWKVDFSGMKDSPPRVRTIEASSREFNAGDTVAFTVRSYPITSAVQYRWFFGDDSSAFGRDVRHVYAKSGMHTVTVVADFGNGLYDTLREENYIMVHAVSPFITTLAFLPAQATGEVVTALNYSLDSKRLLAQTNKGKVYEYDPRTGAVLRSASSQGYSHVAYLDSNRVFTIATNGRPQDNAILLVKTDLNNDSHKDTVTRNKPFVKPDNGLALREFGFCYDCIGRPDGHYEEYGYKKFQSNDDMTVTYGGEVIAAWCRWTDRHCVMISNYRYHYDRTRDSSEAVWAAFYKGVAANLIVDNYLHAVYDIAFSKDGRFYAKAEARYGADSMRWNLPRAIRIRSVADDSEVKVIHETDAALVCFNADGTRIVSNNFSRDLSSGDSVPVVCAGGTIKILRRYNGNERFVVAATTDNAALLQIIDVNTGTTHMDLGRSASQATAMVIAPDNRTIATGTEDGKLVIWSVPDSINIKSVTSVPNDDKIAVKSVFPNPAFTDMYVRFKGVVGQEITPELYDQLGRRIAVFEPQVSTEGINTIHMSLPGSIADGPYVVHLRSARSLVALPVMIVR
jgi:PKD repeat protein